MPFRPALPAVRTAAALLFLAVAMPADAQDSSFPASIVKVPNAPVSIVKCALTNSEYKSTKFGTVVLGNRTTHAMGSASVTFAAYDTEDARMDQKTQVLTFDQPVASADTVAKPIRVDFRLAGRENLLDHVTCRIAAATFAGNRSWDPKVDWKEKFVPLESEAVQSDGGGASGAAGGAGATLLSKPLPTASAAPPRVSVAVVNAWNDTLGSAMFVHDTLAVTGGDTDATLRASDLTLTMTLAGGARKTYGGFARSAPTYQKLNPLGSQTMTAYEVDPATDLGRLGSITIPAHATVTTTVTFFVPDPVATASDNRGVSLR